MLKFLPTFLLFGALAFYLAVTLEDNDDRPGATSSATLSAEATATAVVTPVIDAAEAEASADAEVDEYAELDAAISALVADSGSRISVAVVSEGQLRYSFDHDGTYGLASVVKLYLLAGYLDFLSQQERTPDANEAMLLEVMIQWSDNYAAELIWQTLGGNEQVDLYLTSRGFQGLIPAADGSWGSASTTAADMALFLASMASGHLLNDEQTAYALSLLAGVDASQRWGVTAGVAEADPGASVLVKNGWYPEEEGWLLNSAGLVTPSGGGPGYAVVIFADRIEDYDAGIAMVETVAELTNQHMLGSSSPAGATP